MVNLDYLPRPFPRFVTFSLLWSSVASRQACRGAFGLLKEGKYVSLPITPVSSDIRGQFIFLGTGTSVGVPVIGCGCGVCTSPNPRNQRTRCAVAIGLPAGNVLIDTPPDLRTQLLREGIGVVHAVLFTHEHADHLFGLDDLRIMQFHLGGPVPLYCEGQVEARIRHSFDYAFKGNTTHAGAVPQLVFHRIGLEPIDVLGRQFIPIRLHHGPNFRVLGFRIGRIAYCTDTDHIPEESWPLLENLDVFVVGALRKRRHATHFSLPQAVEAAQRVGARRTYFTHVSHELEYDQTNASLPDGMELAYDGLRIPLT